MKRIDIIFEQLNEKTVQLLEESGSKTARGISASEIADLCTCHRSNASRDLNLLVQQEKAIKLSGKPTTFLSLHALHEHFPSFTTDKTTLKKTDLSKALLATEKKTPTAEYADDFIDLIGCKSSLRSQIDQAKAAVLYPPNGLHMMILGETGVGKSTFVEFIHSFLQKNRESETPLVIFNCADYSYNPELISSQLFGHVKGAFTGADQSKEGLVLQAKKGILFLDEIHRLPPQAQEMLFQLIDKGVYRKLGSTAMNPLKEIMIIGATTEDPESALLETFLRRIPVSIHLPNLEDRSLYEKIELINYFFTNESFRLKETIQVSRNIFLSLLSHTYKSNIGELFSTIQLLCARAYLDKRLNQKTTIEVNLAHLPQNLVGNFVKRRIPDSQSDLHLPFDIKETLLYSYQEQRSQKIINSFNSKYEGDYYNLIDEKYHELSQKSENPNEIWDSLEEIIESYTKSLLMKSQISALSKETIEKFLKPQVYMKITEILDRNPDIHQLISNNNSLYAISLHIENLIERIRQNKYVHHINVKKIESKFQREYRLAETLRCELEEAFAVTIPENETAILTIFMRTFKQTSQPHRINVLVMCHGNHIASDMASVANTLLGTQNVQAFNMPLDMEVKDMLKWVDRYVQALNPLDGLLVLADMGSLSDIETLLPTKHELPIRVIDMVSTPLVIEAARKAVLPKMTVDILASDLRSFSLSKKTVRNKYAKESTPFIRKLYARILEDIFIFLDPTKAVNLLTDALNHVSKQMNIPYSDELSTKFLVHSASMVERVIRNESLQFYKDESLVLKETALKKSLEKGFLNLEQSYGIKIPQSEICYLIEIFSPYLSN